MDPQTELNLLTTAYQNLLSGGIKEYSINGRTLTRLDAVWLVSRMDELRSMIYRQSNGMFAVGQFRTPE